MCTLLFQLEILELLVQNGADLDAKTKNGETPFGEFTNQYKCPIAEYMQDQLLSYDFLSFISFRGEHFC